MATASCGKKGPPLPPFPRVPAAVGAVTPVRMDDAVLLSFAVPSANVDGRQPADVSRLDIYAITATRAPETENQRDLATPIGELPVRPVLPPLPPLPDGSPAPPLPLPPGVDQGATVVFKEELTSDARNPVELPDARRRRVVPTEADAEAGEEEHVERLTGPLVAPAPVQQPRRFYFVVAVSPRGRESLPSTPVGVPLDAAARAPGLPTVVYTETGLTVTWPPSPDARTATIEPPPPPALPVPVTPVVPVPGTDPPAAPVAPALPLLAAKSLGFNTEATTYHLYEVPADPPAEDPLALVMPTPLTPQPLKETEWAGAGVTFGVERCFVVRAVDVVSGVPVHSPPSARACETLRDTFPPAAPKALAAIAGAGVINLIWEPSTEADLAGYLVLRGEAPGATLLALTPVPVRETTFRDTTARPGIRYVYAVVAVDTADPQNVSAQSNRAEETARR